MAEKSSYAKYQSQANIPQQRARAVAVQIEWEAVDMERLWHKAPFHVPWLNYHVPYL